MADKKVWIADGHHRYETACAFRAALGEREVPVAEDYMMMALSSMADPGLVLLPTHRILKNLPYGTEQLLARLAPVFERREVPASALADELREAPTHMFGLATPGMCYLLGPKNNVEPAGDGSEALRALDVSVLHRTILERLLGVQGLESIAYTRDEDEAIRSVDAGAACAFLMNPPTVDDMRTIALGGEKMPQKSTYYFPKILSGLLVWSLNDF